MCQGKGASSSRNVLDLLVRSITAKSIRAKRLCYAGVVIRDKPIGISTELWLYIQ